MRIRIDVEGGGSWESDELVGMNRDGMRAEQDEIEEFASQRGDGYSLHLIGGTEADKELFAAITHMEPPTVLYAMWKLGQSTDNYLHMVLLVRGQDGYLDDGDELDTAIRIAENDRWNNWSNEDSHYVMGADETESVARIMCSKLRHEQLMMGELTTDEVDWNAMASRLRPELVRRWGGKYHVMDYMVNPND